MVSIGVHYWHVLNEIKRIFTLIKLYLGLLQ